MKLGLSERFIELLESCGDFESLQVVARNMITGEIGKFLLPFPVDVPDAYDWEIVDFVTGERFHGEATLRRQVMNLNAVECDALKRLDVLPPNLGVANELYSWLITAREEVAEMFVYFYVDKRELSNEAIRLAVESEGYPTGAYFDPDDVDGSIQDLGRHIFNTRYREDLESDGYDKKLIDAVDYYTLGRRFAEDAGYDASEALGKWVYVG